jgi:hypothetical protein
VLRELGLLAQRIVTGVEDQRPRIPLLDVEDMNAEQRVSTIPSCQVRAGR